jgi:hypothetical protein
MITGIHKRVYNLDKIDHCVTRIPTGTIFPPLYQSSSLETNLIRKIHESEWTVRILERHPHSDSLMSKDGDGAHMNVWFETCVCVCR